MTAVIAPSLAFDLGTASVRRIVDDDDAGPPPGKPLNPVAEPVSDIELRLRWDWPGDVARDQIVGWLVEHGEGPCTAAPLWQGGRQALSAGAADPREFVYTAGADRVVHFRVASIRTGAGAEPETWSDSVCANTAHFVPDTALAVTGARVANGPGADGAWVENETVRAELTFSHRVWVDVSGGRPALAIALDGAERTALWTGGSGSATLEFSYRIDAADAGAKVARVLANGLALNGGTIRNADGRNVPTRFGVAPVVTGVGIEAEADGAWSAGDEVTVAVSFSERVTVSTRGGTPSIGILAGATQPQRALWARGSGTKTLVFAYPMAEADGTATNAVVLRDALALEGGTIVGPSGLAADLRHPAALREGAGPQGLPALGVAGASAVEGAALSFAVTLDRASAQAVTVRYATSDGTASAGTDYDRTAGTLSFAPGETRMAVEVATHADADDEGEETLTLTLSAPAGARVAEGTAVGRIADGTGGQGQQGAALTASVLGAPLEHDGETPFTVRIAFSEPIATGFRALRDHAIEATNARVARARRVDGRSDLWDIRIAPSSHRDVAFSLAGGRSCDSLGAVCTGDGRALSNSITRTIMGLPGLSVADAEATEGPGATLVFEVALSRNASRPVTVDYATSDGTASADDDYVAGSGTLTFAPGETMKTIEVAVLDDGHDEDVEYLLVTLSNASGAWLEDETAIGTIVNSDAMPRAWLARFGRTVADQVLGAVESRMAASRSAGVEVRIAGQRIGGETPDREAIAEAEAQARLAAFADWLHGGECDGAPGASGEGCGKEESRAVSERDLFTGSAFAWTLGGEGAGAASLWGAGAIARFDGREDDLTLDGEVASAMLGVDWAGGRSTAGLVISHSRGKGSYRGAGSGGAVESNLTGAYPWASHALTERLEVWGVAGYGEGELVLTPEGGAALEADMDLAMAAAGARGTVLDGGADGLTLALTGDALAVRTASEAVNADAGAGGNLAAAKGTVLRLRLGLEGAHPVPLDGGAVLTPSFEVGVRHDGGDAETGFGIDVGAGLAWSDRARGIEAELRGRGLLTHEESGFGERALAGRIAWDPRPDSPLGLMLSLSQTLGASASGGMEALIGPRDRARGDGRPRRPAPPARGEARLRAGAARRALHRHPRDRVRALRERARLPPRLAARARAPGGERLARPRARGDPARGRERRP